MKVLTVQGERSLQQALAILASFDLPEKIHGGANASHVSYEDLCAVRDHVRTALGLDGSSGPREVTKPGHVHRCMRCLQEFECHSPGMCIANYDVMPIVITRGDCGVEHREHCSKGLDGVWRPIE